MRIKPDALRLPGYRLPTEAEWEYACRAGTVTSRFYGSSENLLARYAWYKDTSQNHAWPCVSLLPNELGLFDMLGNLCEWCQNVTVNCEPNNKGLIEEPDTNMISIEDASTPRLIRGGAFINHPADVRSAYHIKLAPSSRGVYVG